MKEFLSYLFESKLKATLSIVIFLITLFALGVGLHRIFWEGNRYIFYWKGFDPIGLFFGAFAFLISIIITIKIQHNTSIQNTLKEDENKLKQKELDENNSYIIQKTDEIENNINSLIKQYQNIEVVSNFKEVMEQINLLYKTTIDAQSGQIENNGEKKQIEMQLKIMNHSASFGRLLCSDIEILKKQNSDFEAISTNPDKLKELIEDTRRQQKITYNMMKQAYNSIHNTANKYYITLSATKKVDGTETAEMKSTAYNLKYLSKLNVEDETCVYSNYDSSKRFVQKVDTDFSDYLIKEKQLKQINELAGICQMYDAYSFNIPFQTFMTLPVDENVLSERFYRCIFFFINDNTIGKGLQLSAICTSNINFVKSISKALDAEKDTLKPYIKK
jgi:hypothetical protein